MVKWNGTISDEQAGEKKKFLSADYADCTDFLELNGGCDHRFYEAE